MSARARIVVAAIELDMQYIEERQQRTAEKVARAVTPRQRRRAVKQHRRVSA